MKKKTNIKEHIDGDVMDLSMIDLQDVPVKEIASFPKVKNLDVSTNKISQLSEYFSICLTHLIKLDLSNNRLTSLPTNFGCLVNLRYLDLNKNKISTIPLSFGNLKLLNWLDVSENPLMPKIAEVVGICLNTSDCQIAAKRLVAFMAEINLRVNLEKERLKEVKKMQEVQAELELFKRKEKKDKKKKKKLLKSMANGGDKTEMDNLANEEFMQKQIHSYSQLPRKNKPNIVWRFLAALFKIFFYTTLFSCFAFFVIRLIDEPTYKTVKLSVNKWASQASIHLPKGMISVYNESVKLSNLYGKIIWRRLAEFGQRVIVSGTEWYTWISTDETTMEPVSLPVNKLKYSNTCNKICNPEDFLMV